MWPVVPWTPRCCSCGHCCLGWHFSVGCVSCSFLDLVAYAPCTLRTHHCHQLVVHLWQRDMLKILMIRFLIHIFYDNSPLQRTVLEEFFLGGSITDSMTTVVPGPASRWFSMCRSYRESMLMSVSLLYVKRMKCNRLYHYQIYQIVGL